MATYGLAGVAEGLGLTAFLGLPGGAEWIIILAVVLLLFGPSQLPKLAKMFGKSAKTLKDTMDGKFEDDDEDESAKKKASSEKKDADTDEDAGS